MSNDNDIFDQQGEGEAQHHEELDKVTHIKGMYENWFLEYASYVILERAVPYVEDGLKPVQRRILHSMWELEDGRYNKVANIIGHTMKYHPHGDASIGDALVQLGQKDLLIDCQGNWGNIYTGDSAAAPRYIEARLSKLGQEIVFNPKTTQWQSSYDGRNKEPITLPVKFPLLLAQGVEGIAVGLACKILPHNFNELIDASIASLRGRKTDIVPDFITGGMADFSQYNDGLRGGKIRVRARIKQLDKKTLAVTEIPFGTTTGGLIETIIAANEKGKIKVRKIEDNTAENVEILIHLHPEASPDKTIDALYAFTGCEVSISPNACIIENEKPRFVGVNEMLRISTKRTLDLLKLELEIEMHELREQLHFASLEKIFIEKRIYRDIEEARTWEAVLEAIDLGLKPYKKKFVREVTREDIIRLTEIRIKRISKFDAFKADEQIKNLNENIARVQNNLDNLVDYAVNYFRELKKKYGAGRERKTEIRPFEEIDTRQVAAANVKLYANWKEGFIGSGLKKDDFVFDCSDLDEVIVFRRDGGMMVTKVSEKTYVGKDIMHIQIFKRNDDRTVYNMVYRDGLKGNVMMKRFSVTGITRDKDYSLTRGTKDSKVFYLSINPNGESEILNVYLHPNSGARKLEFDVDLTQLAIKGRDSQGNILTRYQVQKVTLKEKGKSTFGARKVWFDDSVRRLTYDVKGTFLGDFGPEDKILTITQSGHYRLTGIDLTTHFDEDMILIEKFDPKKPVSAIYWDGESKTYFIKRFIVEPSEKKRLFITEAEGSKLEAVSTSRSPVAHVKFGKEKGKELPPEKIDVESFIEIRNLNAKGNKLSPSKVKEADLIDPFAEIPQEELAEEESGLSPMDKLRKEQEKKGPPRYPGTEEQLKIF
ncbi:MAG: topoisomerase IV subunit A [Bacteroidetes bacterium]|nr:MAG: topoisomerase IV subunit A [Bacteroidota bacterium]